MSEDRDIRAAQARYELDLTSEVFAKTRASLIENLISTKLGEDRLREKYALTLQGLDAVRAALEAMIQAPKDDALIAEHLATLKEQMAAQ